MGTLLLYVEQHAGVLKKSAYELATQGSRLAKEKGLDLAALLIGNNLGNLGEDLGAYGVKNLYHGCHPDLDSYKAAAHAAVLTQMSQDLKAEIILASASLAGLEVLPRVGACLKAGVASDCTALKIANGKLVATRPVFAGKALVDVHFSSAVQIASLRPNSCPPQVSAPGAKLKPQKKELSPASSGLIVKEVKEASVGKVDLAEAEIIVSGGRALGSQENFKILQDLAQPLGAAVGASRAAVDAGYAKHEMQVGQTGKTVNPKLYIACGISGAIQHLAGMQTSKVIVAINKDPEAPIFSRADYGIVGDLFEVVPALTEEVKKLHR